MTSSLNYTPTAKVFHWSKAALVASILLITVAGCSVAQLQAGLETPSDAVLAKARSETRQTQYAARIASYDRFVVPSTDNVSISVYARESTDATTNIMLVHGAGSGAWAWEYYFELLPDDYNIYALSWRGHFDSTDVEDADAGDYVDDQIAVLQAIRNRNALDTHLIGHSYGGATSVLQVADAEVDVRSLILIAPVVPLDYTLAQRIVVPTIAPFFIRRSLKNGNETDGIYGGMFLSAPRMQRYHDLYAGKDYAREKPGLIAKDGVSADWQETLKAAYMAVCGRGLPVTMVIARYDNVIVSRRQREMAEQLGAAVIELDSGHYVQLDVEAHRSAEIITELLQANWRCPPIGCCRSTHDCRCDTLTILGLQRGAP